MLGSRYENECEVLDTTSPNGIFQSLTERPLVQDQPAVCVVNSDVYLFGGEINDFTKSTHVQKYSTLTDKWNVLSDLQYGVDIDHPCFVQKNAIHIYKSDGEFQESYLLNQK